MTLPFRQLILVWFEYLTRKLATEIPDFWRIVISLPHALGALPVEKIGKNSGLRKKVLRFPLADFAIDGVSRVPGKILETQIQPFFPPA